MNTLPATSAQLLQTAERLFAQLGIDAVSTRRIAQEANQRNVSALQYHFGSKDNLIDALLAMRLQSINAHRQRMLDELSEPLAETDLHDLVRALVLPLADQLDAPGNHFIGCLHQLYLHARGERVYSNMQPELTAALQTVTDAISQQLAHLPTTVRLARLRLMGSQLIHSVGDWYYQRERGEVLPATDELAATLIDFIVGGLLAPVSPTASKATNPSADSRRTRAKKNTRKDIRDE